MPPRELPTFSQLPSFHEFTGCAWDVWGKGDQLGTINLLTDEVVKEAAEEIKSGKVVSLNWPLQFPQKPLFGRQALHHEIWIKYPPFMAVNDDSISINTQSGSQWDGMRHFGIVPHGVMYQNTPAESFPRGHITHTDGANIDPEVIKLGIHNWADHGICGRGVLLDLARFFTAGGTKPLPYDPWTTHAITVADLHACAAAQGTTFRHGDILLIRAGFIQKWHAVPQATRDSLEKIETFAGIEQSEEMKAFLWDNHFAAVASDQPALERYPDPTGAPRMHQTLLGLWGMPIGEMFDLEKLGEIAAATKRYTFFFSSWPLNVLGGVGSPPNAAAYF